VTVSIQGGDLIIEALDVGQQVSVQVSPGHVNVQGLAGTTVVFAAGFNPADFTGNVIIDVGGNGDVVRVANSSISGSLTIEQPASLAGMEGEAPDAWTVSNVTVGGELSVTQVTGSATLNASNAFVGGDVRLAFGGQSGTAALSNFSAPGSLAVTLGAGSNVLNISNGAIGQVSLTPGADAGGADQVFIQNASLGTLSAQLGSGDNALSVRNTTLQQLAVSVAADAEGHNGDNTVTLGGVSAQALNVALGDGNDAVSISNSVFRQASLDGGGGTDTLRLNNDSFGSLTKENF
jgi:hypothetical protein